MSRVVFLIILMGMTAVAPASAQRHKLSEVNTETEEGKLLQAIGQESDEARKLQMIEQFTTQYGSHQGLPWVLSQGQPLWVKNGNFDRVLDAGEKLVADDPMDLGAAYASLKAAESKKDSEMVLKWAATTGEIARKSAQAPKGEGVSDEDHKREIDYAAQIGTYSEYALYAASLAEQDPPKLMKLVEGIEKVNPNSQYISQAFPRYAVAARTANALPTAVAYGERAFGRGQFDEDMLLAMADFHLNQPSGKQNLDKVVTYSTKAVEIMNAKQKPETVSEADWNRKKGLGYWMLGTALSTQGKYGDADKSMRTALPLVKDNELLLAGALFHLGIANYQIGKGKDSERLKEGYKFLQQCAAMKTPFQQQAQKNVAVIRKETGLR
jgi:tetratricopeptide (TPR) repeat protein